MIGILSNIFSPLFKGFVDKITNKELIEHLKDQLSKQEEKSAKEIKRLQAELRRSTKGANKSKIKGE